MSPVRSADRAISAQMSFGSCGTESTALTGTTQLPPVSARQVCGAEGAAEVSTSHGTIACVFVDDGLLNVLFDSLKMELGRLDSTKSLSLSGE